MINGLLGRKVGMTQIFNEAGDEIPVTLLELGPCPVVDIIESTKGKRAQLSLTPILKKDPKKVLKPIRGKFAKAKVKPHKILREIEIANSETVKIGNSFKVDIFKDTHYVNVIGTSKGKGFQGVVRRHGFKGAQTMSHGTHEAFRHGGSIGMCEYPARVLKGHKMPGRMGGKRITTLNLEVIKIFEAENLMLVKGAVPGSNGSLVIALKSARKEKTEQQATKAKFVNPLKMSKRGGK
ncbi:MAG: 50S ribosomal protein L3 [Nitrospinota bacterium]